MISFRKRYLKKNNLLNYTPLLFIIIIISLTIGFSAFQNDLLIGDIEVTIEPQKNMMVTDITVLNSSSNSLSHWENHTSNSISSSIYLPNEDSTMTYLVTIKNFGNIEAGITEINGLPDNLTYSIKNYTLENILCDDNDSTKCKLGSTSTLEITIKYAQNEYNSNSLTTEFEMNFVFAYVEYTAKINNNYYSTLQSAINTVPNSTETTIILLKNTSEIISVNKGKNIILELQNNTLSNDGNNPVINNEGILQINNGTIASNALSNGAINNQSTGIITINGGNVFVTGGRQALYNNKGVATITGNAYLTSTTKDRTTVQNLAGGTLTILSGTIISTATQAVSNAGTMTIGVKDGIVNTSSPIIQGVTNGIAATSNFNFYDGTIRYKTTAISDASKISDLEEGYGLVSSEENIDGVTYKTSFLGTSVHAVTFNSNKGTASETKRFVATNEKIGELPTAIRSGYTFVGWFTQNTDGEEITKDTIIVEDVTFYAHWNKIDKVAKININGNDTIYDSIQDAINAASDEVETEIILLKNTNEVIEVASNKNIRLNLNDNTITNNLNKAVIENYGTLEIVNGTITSKADTATINQNDGVLTISSGEIIATGSRQAIYINAGTVKITGSAYLSSQTSGKPTNTNIERGTIQNLSNGTLIVTGGTIIGLQQQAISNEGTLIIGEKDGNIDISTPTLIGKVYGVKTSGKLNFYDGIIKGQTDSINGEISAKEDNSTLNNTTEIIDNKTYKVSYLS